MSKARFFHIGPKGRLTEEKTLEEALASVERGGYVWLDYVDPPREELMRLVEPLDVHTLSIDDCLDEDQVPKIEDFSRNTFLLVNRFEPGEGEIRIDEVDFIVGANFLVTVNRDAEAAARFYDKLDEQVRLEIDDVRKGPDFLMHVILDYIVDRKYAAVERLQDRIDAAEETILGRPREFRPEDLMRLRRSLLAVRKSLLHEREIFVKICRRDSPFVTEKAIYHYRDIYDHLAKFFEATEIAREMITSLMEMYLSLINNDMSRTAQRTNAVIRRLTLITTIFMPLSLLAGIGGMSEWTMMTGPGNWPLAYAAFLGGLVVVGLVSYGILRRVERRAGRER